MSLSVKIPHLAQKARPDISISRNANGYEPVCQYLYTIIMPAKIDAICPSRLRRLDFDC